MLIAVIGDCLLDISVRPFGPMRPGADAPADIRLSPGGQGANVAVRLARRGARVRLITGLADDATGRFLRAAVEAEGVDLVAMPVAASGSVIALLAADGERTMLSDRAPFGIDRLRDLIADAGWVHVSGYALRDANGPTIARVLAARPRSVRLSVGGGSVPPGSEAAIVGGTLRSLRADLLILSRDEAEALGESVAAVTVVTDGRRGSTGFGVDGKHLAVDGLSPDDALDATGAGDAYAGALIHQLATIDGWPPTPEKLRRAMELATAVGAAAVRVAGAQGGVPGERTPEQPFP